MSSFHATEDFMSNQAHRAYLYIKHRNKYRGIPFLFEEKEWIAWWVCHLGPDWLKLRGRKRGQYVMARKGDKGPYAPGNVECLTCDQNVADQVKHGTRAKLWGLCQVKGEKHWNSKLTESQVLAIFNSKLSNKLIALKYNITARAVRSIKHKKRWKHLLDKYQPPARMLRAG